MSDPHQKREPLALMAAKVILQAKVSGAAKAIGGCLLDHVNWASKRCDPGLDRICALTGHSRSTVQAGIRQLQRDGLLFVRVHGGRGRSCQYDLAWSVVRERDRVAQMARKSKRQPPGNATASGPEIRAQTLSVNPKGEPEGRSQPTAAETSRMGCRLGEQGSEALSGRPTSSRASAAWASAEKRWHQDLHARFGADRERYSAIVEATSVELNDEATTAELAVRGSGLPFVLARLGIEPIGARL